jgi:DNA polymerase V
MYAIVDCNSFYCSCERLFVPSLYNRPVAVLSNNDGCIISRTDEAKALGLGMGAPYFQYRELIEQNGITIFSSNYHLYGDISRRVMDTLRSVAGNNMVEVYSVDEAFINLKEVPDQKLSSFIQELKERTEQWTGIQVSVGVGATKVLSKVANRLAKKKQSSNRLHCYTEYRRRNTRCFTTDSCWRHMGYWQKICLYAERVFCHRKCLAATTDE